MSARWYLENHFSDYYLRFQPLVFHELTPCGPQSLTQVLKFGSTLFLRYSSFKAVPSVYHFVSLYPPFTLSLYLFLYLSLYPSYPSSIVLSSFPCFSSIEPAFRFRIRMDPQKVCLVYLLIWKIDKLS
jgi:hypothetical protein